MEYSIFKSIKRLLSREPKEDDFKNDSAKYISNYILYDSSKKPRMYTVKARFRVKKKPHLNP